MQSNLSPTIARQEENKTKFRRQRERENLKYSAIAAYYEGDMSEGMCIGATACPNGQQQYQQHKVKQATLDENFWLKTDGPPTRTTNQ